MAAVEPRSLRVKYGSATKAEVDAGTYIIPAMPGRRITIHDAWVRAHGTCSDGTSVNLDDGTTIVCIFTQAGLVNHTVLRAGTATTGVSANLNTALAGGAGVRMITVGNALGTTTDIDYCVKYSVT